MIFDYLTEVYIGKTKELLLAETQLDIFRKKYMRQQEEYNPLVVVVLL